MQGQLTYFLDHANATVDLSLTAQRFIVTTQGKGALDKPQLIDIPLSDLKQFCLVPTIAAQNIVGGTRGQMSSDYSYDSEFIFSYHNKGKVKTKRVFIHSGDETWQSLLESLARRRPDASLLHMKPSEAQKQMGVISGRAAVYIIIGFIIAIPLIIVLITIITAILSS